MTWGGLEPRTSESVPRSLCQLNNRSNRQEWKNISLSWSTNCFRNSAGILKRFNKNITYAGECDSVDILEQHTPDCDGERGQYPGQKPDEKRNLSDGP